MATYTLKFLKRPKEYRATCDAERCVWSCAARLESQVRAEAEFHIGKCKRK